MTDTSESRLKRIEALPETRRLFDGISKSKDFTAENAHKAFAGVHKETGMKDTVESVRKLAEELFITDPFNYDGGVYDALYRYAALLERIEKAPVAIIVNDFAVSAIPFGYSNDEKMQLLEGKRVALLQVEE